MDKNIINLAQENEKYVDGTMTTVWKSINDNDVVFAVWPDAEKLSSHFALIIKGKALLETVARGSALVPTKVSAIRCRDLEQAIALEQVVLERM